MFYYRSNKQSSARSLLCVSNLHCSKYRRAITVLMQAKARTKKERKEKIKMNKEEHE
jgi:hypothetical protein